MTNNSFLDLYDFRRRILAMYRERDTALERGDDPSTVWKRFWEERTRVFASHPQSALDNVQKQGFKELRVFPYSSDAVVRGSIDTDVAPRRIEVYTSGEEAMPMSLVGRVSFRLAEQPCSLSLYWIDVYGGGLFLPFRDTHEDTYGGGRYLVDTVKGSGFEPREGSPGSGEVILDFNYAYNPSCAYNHRWVCPLAPPENRLEVPIAAGEKTFIGDVR